MVEQSHLHCIIMAGGIGSRFWPMSKSNRPKQFIDILGCGQTLIQQTYERFSKICPPENILVVTNEKYKDLCIEQLPELNKDQILCEPARRNTAPCIAYANQKIAAKDPHAVIIATPSDHVIFKEDLFYDNILSAINVAQQRPWLLTLGIRPHRPDTAYGYIQYDEMQAHPQEKQVKKVKVFTEKPNIDLARSFIESGDFLWNSGIFIWTLESINCAMSKFLPDVYNIFSEGVGIYNTPKEHQFLERAYAVSKSISIDYGLMEKADNVYVLEADFGWSDLGTWDSMFDIRSKDEDNNAVVGENVMLYDSNNCFVHMPNEKLAVLQGLDGYIAVEEDNVLLVCRRTDEQHIRQFVTDIKMQKGEEYV